MMMSLSLFIYIVGFLLFVILFIIIFFKKEENTKRKESNKGFQILIPFVVRISFWPSSIIASPAKQLVMKRVKNTTLTTAMAMAKDDKFR